MNRNAAVALRPSADTLLTSGGAKSRGSRSRTCTRRRLLAIVSGTILLAVASTLIPTTMATPLPARADAGSLRRLALLAGNNEGGEGTKPLHYAHDDARKMHTVLTELGGVRREDALLLLGGSADDFAAALAALEASAAAARLAGQRTVLLVYYSGHAKDGALRMGRTRFSIEALKQRLGDSSPAHVRLGILDACRSGVVNRTKGARKGPGFEIAADGMNDAQGLVLLTSSSADEDSQESDALAGSYFSHHLTSGLRGGADRSGDRLITLSEAYEYAYARTVAETADTAAGAQHPTFGYDLTGNGNLVLSELGLGREGIYVPPQAPPGVYYFVDAARGVVSAEVTKAVAQDRVVALSPGRYRIKRRLADRLRIGDVRVGPGGFTTIDEATFKDAAFSDDPVKGARPGDGVRLGLSLGATMQAFFDRSTRASLFPPTGLLGAELTVRNFFRRDWIFGLDVAAGGTDGALVRDTVGSTLPFRFAELNLGTSLVAEFPLGEGRFSPYLGSRLAFLVMSRTFQGTAATVPEQYMTTFSPGLQGGLRVHLGWGLTANLRGRIHYVQYAIDENRALGFWELGGVLGYEL